MMMISQDAGNQEQQLGQQVGLLVSLALALGVHAMLLPLTMRILAAGAGSEAVLQADETEQFRSKLAVGGEDALRARVAWISHEAFTELIARRSSTQQPALQEKAEPIPGAPLDELDPIEGGEETQPPAVPSQQESARPLSPPADPLQTPVPVAIPPDPGAAIKVPVPADAAAPLEPMPQSDSMQGPLPSAGSDAAVRSSEAFSQGGVAQPTGADRSDRESQPTILRDVPWAVRANGQVIVGPGIEIKTFAPRFSAVAVASSAPGAQNPVARLTFNTDGTVLRVVLQRSTGAENLDAPVIASLYRWRASGLRVEAATEPFDFEVRLLLTPEM